MHMTRRRLLEGLVAAPAAAVLLAACSDGDSATDIAEDGNGTASPGSSTGSSTTAAAASGTTSTGSTASAATDAWASGGTDLITVAYPDTSIFAAANICTVALTPATTEGPCYFQADTSDDISLGKTGLPMQLCTQLVDHECTPLEGYTIEVWGCDTRGIYSGDTSDSDDSSSFAGSFCTADDAEAVSSIYLRGQATTDAEGRVNFASIFPGWYRGRTIHIHFAVTDPDGTTRVISQWCFPDEFTAEICTTHDQYADRGIQDTTLASRSDTVFPADSWEDYVLSHTQNSDGTLLAYGVIQIDPTAVATESASGSGAGGGPRP